MKELKIVLFPLKQEILRINQKMNVAIGRKIIVNNNSPIKRILMIGYGVNILFMPH